MRTLIGIFHFCDVTTSHGGGGGGAVRASAAPTASRKDSSPVLAPDSHAQAPPQPPFWPSALPMGYTMVKGGIVGNSNFEFR